MNLTEKRRLRELMGQSAIKPAPKPRPQNRNRFLISWTGTCSLLFVACLLCGLVAQGKLKNYFVAGAFTSAVLGLPIVWLKDEL